MDIPVLWYHCSGTGPSFPDTEQVRALVARETRVRRQSWPERDAPGLVFFDRASDELCEWAVRAGRSTEAPMFAVSVAAERPSDDEHWRLLEAGFADVFARDGGYDLRGVICARLDCWLQTERLLRSPPVQDRLVGQSAAWRKLVREIVHIARFTSDAVLVTGESGTGKELVAQVIHELDARPDKGAFVVVDCANLGVELAGSELFGHERGAFTGAVNAREGAVALADGGTLFLDEIGELPLALQAQLLRVLQERTYKRMGGNTWLRSSFRLVCATNRDLEAEVEEGRFRADLYYRIAGWVCTTPPLRQRTEDILPLANHFLAQSRAGQPAPALDAAVRDYLLTRDYPGNVRDLRLVASRLAHRHWGPGPITAGEVPAPDRPCATLPRGAWLDRRIEGPIREALDRGIGLKELGQCVAEAAIRIALEMEHGSLPRAARRLGVTDRALQLRRATGRPH